MTPYAQLPTNKPEEFLRTVGLSQEDFLHLHVKLAVYLDEQKALNPLSRCARKDSKLTLEDRLLLTLYYFRHYPALINLAAVFGISESSWIPLLCLPLLFLSPLLFFIGSYNAF